MNNLDRYFTLNLDEESRERVLNNVKELMKITDWSYIDKTSVLAMDSANPQSHLNQILASNEDFQKRKAAELALEQEEQQNAYAA